jgi:putative hemolysin
MKEAPMTAIRRCDAPPGKAVCGCVRMVGVMLLAAVSLLPAYSGDVDGGRRTDGAGVPDPASVHCEQEGGRVEIVEDPDGSQRGVCVFPDGSRCDEWAFYRGRCAPGDHRS